MNIDSPKRGFSLIELLVVISIILLVASIIILGGSGAGGGAALSSSQRILSGIAQGARGQAILKGSTTRLIIHDDPSELDKYRRFFGIVYEGTDRRGDTGWIAATQGTYLPKGIYFDAATSATESGVTWTVANQMKLDFPRNIAQPGDTGNSYYYYEFSSNGNAVGPNAWLVLRAGTMIPNGDGSSVNQLRVDEDESGLKTALIFRRAGTTTLVNEPEAIIETSASEIE